MQQGCEERHVAADTLCARQRGCRWRPGTIKHLCEHDLLTRVDVASQRAAERRFEVATTVSRLYAYLDEAYCCDAHNCRQVQCAGSMHINIMPGSLSKERACITRRCAKALRDHKLCITISIHLAASSCGAADLHRGATPVMRACSVTAQF